MPSGDPRKQPRPDGRAPDATQQMVEAFPPNLSMVATEIGARAVPFAFQGGKAIDLEFAAGPLTVNVHFHPDFADAVCEEIQQAKMKAQTGLVAATPSDLAQVNGNGSH